MKKSLALVLALMMILSMFTMGISVSAADMPEGAIAINTADDLAKMEANKYYYLNADITIGSPKTLKEIDGSTTHEEVNDKGNTVQVQNEAAKDAVEAALITIPAGATLDGNNHTIYYGNYVTNPGWYGTNNKFANSLNWTHEIFAFAAGDTITMKNIKFGSKDLPVYLTTKTNAPKLLASDGSSKIYGGSDDAYGMFRDDIGVNVNWSNVSFFVERYGRGLSNGNFGCVINNAYGNHNFDMCEMNVSIMSAGSQYGLWICNKQTATAKAGELTFTNCVNKGFTTYAGYTVDSEGVRSDDIYLGGAAWGSVGNGFVWASKNKTVITNCINYVNIGATYGSPGEFFSGFIGDVKSGSATVTACVNYGDFDLNKITIGGGIIGRTQSGSCTDFVIKNCINYGNVYRSNSAGTTSNHGFGGITGHSGSTTTYEVSGCTNYGNIQGAGNIGGIVGLFEGAATEYIVKNNVNYGDITSVGNKDAGGIVGQARMNCTISGNKNFGNINGKADNGGIVGRHVTGGTLVNINNNVNYGVIGSKDTATASAGIISTTTQAATYNINNNINYGKVTTYQWSGGILAYASGAGTYNIGNCQNFGEIIGVHGIAGIVAEVGNNAATKLTISNTLNAGNVHELPGVPGEGIGGFVGRIQNSSTTIALINCVNTGTITGSTKTTNMYGSFGDTFGQFIGAYSVGLANNYTGNDVEDAGIVGGFRDWTDSAAVKPTLTSCRALGKAVVGNGATALKGWITAVRNDDDTVTALKQENCTNNAIPVTEPANNGYYGVNVQISDTSAIWGIDNAANAPANLYPYLKGLFKQDFIAGNTDLGENAYVTATPMLRGYQMSTDGTSIRFIATINTSNYANVGFVYSITANGQAIATDATNTATSIWTALNVAGKDSTITTVSASDLGAKYMTGITFNNIPAVGTYKFTVTPVATDANGNTVYTGTAYEITVTHGAVTSVTK